MRFKKSVWVNLYVMCLRFKNLETLSQLKCFEVIGNLHAKFQFHRTTFGNWCGLPHRVLLVEILSPLLQVKFIEVIGNLHANFCRFSNSYGLGMLLHMIFNNLFYSQHYLNEPHRPTTWPITPIIEILLTLDQKTKCAKFQVDSLGLNRVILRNDRQTNGQTVTHNKY